jgi:ribonuclease VapC
LIRQLPIEILPVDEQTVLAAAHIRANYAVSYADAFAIAGAQEVGGIMITGDPEFRAVEEEVIAIRQ